MPNGYEMEDLETIVEMLESDESDESDEMMAERSRRRSFRPPRTAPGRGTMPPRPQPGNFVTQAQLQAGLARVEQQLRTNSAAIQTVSNRVNTVAAEQTRQATALRREIAGQRRDFNQKLQLFAILPLISRPRSEQITVPDANAPGGTRTVSVLTDSGDGLTALLPLLLVGGLGGSSGSGGSSGTDSSTDSSSLLLLAVALGGGFGGRN
jgi:hypothetical protein